MKQCIILGVSLLVSLIYQAACANTCPTIAEFGQFGEPPAGWTLLIPSTIPFDDKFEFGSATHSLNGSFYYKQVICKYAQCLSTFCPAFTILSNDTYNLPNTPLPPWGAPSPIVRTLTCEPPDHDPSHCVFE